MLLHQVDMIVAIQQLKLALLSFHDLQRRQVQDDRDVAVAADAAAVFVLIDVSTATYIHNIAAIGSLPFPQHYRLYGVIPTVVSGSHCVIIILQVCVSLTVRTTTGLHSTYSAVERTH